MCVLGYVPSSTAAYGDMGRSLNKVYGRVGSVLGSLQRMSIIAHGFTVGTVRGGITEPRQQDGGGAGCTNDRDSRLQRNTGREGRAVLVSYAQSHDRRCQEGFQDKVAPDTRNFLVHRPRHMLCFFPCVVRRRKIQINRRRQNQGGTRNRL